MLHEWFALRPLVLVPEEGVGGDQGSAQGKPRLWQEVTGSAEELGGGAHPGTFLAPPGTEFV